MDKLTARRDLIEQRLNLPDRLQRADLLQRVMRIWLVGREDAVIGAYWPIKGEFDPLPALYRWQEDAILSQESEGNQGLALEGRAEAATENIANRSPRKIGLPVVNKVHKTLTFHAWYPGCPMEEDAYGIPKPKDTELIVPTLLFVPCTTRKLSVKSPAVVPALKTPFWSTSPGSVVRKYVLAAFGSAIWTWTGPESCFQE